MRTIRRPVWLLFQIEETETRLYKGFPEKMNHNTAPKRDAAKNAAPLSFSVIQDSLGADLNIDIYRAEQKFIADSRTILVQRWKI